MDKVAQNTFSDGLVLDTNPLVTPDTALTNCLNGTIITFNNNEYVLQNDIGNSCIKLKGADGTLKEVKLKPGFIPIGVKEFNGVLYIVSYNPNAKEGEPNEEIGSFPSPAYDDINAQTSNDHFSKGLDQETISGELFEDVVLNRGNPVTVRFTTQDNTGLSDTTNVNYLNSSLISPQHRLEEFKVYEVTPTSRTDITNLYFTTNLINTPSLVVLNDSQCRDSITFDIEDNNSSLEYEYINHSNIDSFKIINNASNSGDEYILFGTTIALYIYNGPDGKKDLGSVLTNELYNYIEGLREVNILKSTKIDTFTLSGLDYIPYNSTELKLGDLVSYTYNSQTNKYTKEYNIDISDTSIFPVNGYYLCTINGCKNVGGSNNSFISYQDTEHIPIGSENILIGSNVGFYWTNERDYTLSDIYIKNVLGYNGSEYCTAFFDLDDTSSKRGKIIRAPYLEGSGADTTYRVDNIDSQINLSHNYIVLVMYKQEGDTSWKTADVLFYWPDIVMTTNNNEQSLINFEGSGFPNVRTCWDDMNRNVSYTVDTSNWNYDDEAFTLTLGSSVTAEDIRAAYLVMGEYEDGRFVESRYKDIIVSSPAIMNFYRDCKLVNVTGIRLTLDYGNLMIAITPVALDEYVYPITNITRFFNLFSDISSGTSYKFGQYNERGAIELTSTPYDYNITCDINSASQAIIRKGSGSNTPWIWNNESTFLNSPDDLYGLPDLTEESRFKIEINYATNGADTINKECYIPTDKAVHNPDTMILNFTFDSDNLHIQCDGLNIDDLYLFLVNKAKESSTYRTNGVFINIHLDTGESWNISNVSTSILSVIVYNNGTNDIVRLYNYSLEDYTFKDGDGGVPQKSISRIKLGSDYKDVCNLTICNLLVPQLNDFKKMSITPDIPSSAVRYKGLKLWDSDGVLMKACNEYNFPQSVTSAVYSNFMRFDSKGDSSSGDLTITKENIKYEFGLEEDYRDNICFRLMSNTYLLIPESSVTSPHELWYIRDVTHDVSDIYLYPIPVNEGDITAPFRTHPLNTNTTEFSLSVTYLNDLEVNTTYSIKFTPDELILKPDRSDDYSMMRAYL